MFIFVRCSKLCAGKQTTTTNPQHLDLKTSECSKWKPASIKKYINYYRNTNFKKCKKKNK